MNASRFGRTVVRPLWCGVILLLCAGVGAQGDDVLPGFDIFETVPGPGSRLNFADNPIPADFFEPGSDPFVDDVALSGVPFDPLFSGPTDAHVHRANPGVFGGDPPRATVDIELISLSLVSVEPVVVTSNGGQAPTLWDVNVTLGASPATGQLTLQEDVPGPDGGGTILAGQDQPFESFFDVFVEVDFVRANDGQVRLLPSSADRLVLSDRAPWSHGPPRGTWILPGDLTSNFFPGGSLDPDDPVSSLRFDGVLLDLELRGTPEPTVLSMLAFGVLAVIRRRRK